MIQSKTFCTSWELCDWLYNNWITRDQIVQITQCNTYYTVFYEEKA